MNKSSLGYDQLENYLEIEIFGLNFKIEANEKYFEKLKNVKINDKTENEVIETIINECIEENAYKKIKEKYESDLKKDIDIIVWAKVIYFIYEELEKYVKQIRKESNIYIAYEDRYKKQKNYRRNKRNYRRY